MNPVPPVPRLSPGATRSTVDADAAKEARGLLATKMQPFCRLLKHHTEDEFLSLLANKRDWEIQLRPFMRGKDIEPLLTYNYLGMWLLSNREPEAFLACLDMVAGKSLTIGNKASAETLLEAVQGTKPVTDLRIAINFSGDATFNAEVINPLGAAFKLNNGLDVLHINFVENCRGSVAPLFDALGMVKDLDLGVSFEAFNPEILFALTQLFWKNNGIKSFNLNQRCPPFAEANPEYTAAISSLLESLKRQRRLRSLIITGVPETGQKALGEFMAISQTIAYVRVSLFGDAFTEPLLAGLRQNTSLDALHLHVLNLENSMMPIIDLFAENKCSVQDLTVRTDTGRSDMADGSFICKMLGANTTLSFFHWDFIEPGSIDLVLLGSALEKNTSLEHLIIDRHNARAGSEKFVVELAVKAQLPAFVGHLSRNRTLTKFDFFPGNKSFEHKMLADPGIQNILDRNRSYRDHACSEAFITGAACGLFQELHLPTELGVLAAPHLQKQRPRLKAGSLAFVNKATYQWALENRGQDKARMVGQAAATGIGKEKSDDRS